MSNREILVENLEKKYPGDVVAVDDVSFKVNAGEVFGFLGPNGAGKSTTIKILTTLALPTSGRAKVGGYDVDLTTGLGDVSLTVPDSLEAQIKLSGMADLTMENSRFEQDALENWVTAGYDESTEQVQLTINAIFGSVVVD